MATADSSLVPLDPVDAPDSVADWRPANSLGISLARFWNRHAPRGKGAIPRMIGRRLGGAWKFTIETESGCRLAVNPAHLDLYLTIEREGAWEPWIIRACRDIVQPSDVVYDVGANAGAISNEIAAAIPGAQIYAFEPQPSMAKLVAISAKLNGHQNIRVMAVAVGETEGSATLHCPAHALHASLAEGQGDSESIDCRVISLGERVKCGHLPPPDMIKVDVEGGELGVIEGALEAIRTSQPAILFEANDNASRFGYTRTDLMRKILDCGDYEFYQVAPGDTLAMPRSRKYSNRHGYRAQTVDT